MVLPAIYGVVASSAGGGPSEPLNLALEHPGIASSTMKLTWSLPADTAGGVTGYQIIKDGSVLVANTNTSSRSYTATGLTVSTSYSFQVAGISASGLGLPCTAVAKSTIAAATISYSGGSPKFYYASTQQGYLVYQFKGSGSFYVSSNADSAPISVYAVGGGGATGSYWSGYGGGGGGGMYIAENLTNIPVGSGHTMTFALGGGASGGTYGTGGSDTTVTNLHYNGSSWSTATAGYGETGGWMQGPTSGGGGSGSSGNSTNAGNTASYGNTGGTGGQGFSYTAGGLYGPNGGGDGGGGGGSGGWTGGNNYPGTGTNGSNGTASASSSNGGNGGQGFAFSASKGMGSIDTGGTLPNNSMHVLNGIGGGGGGTAYRSSYYSPNQGYAYRGAAYHGGGTGCTAYIAWVASAIYGASCYSHTSPHGGTYSGGGAACVIGGGNSNGGSGGVYVRLHT